MPIFKIRPINFYKRDRAVFNQAAKGQLTSCSLLEIEYGEFPMKGIDIANVNDRPVSLRGILQDKNSGIVGKTLTSLLTLGYVHGKKTPASALGGDSSKKDADQKTEYDRAIYLNKLFYSPLGQYVVLHGNHTPLTGWLAALATGATTLVQATMTVGAYIKNHYLIAALFLSSARLMPVVQILTFPFRAAMDTIGHEHVHVLQVHDEADTKFNPATSDLCGNLKKSLPTPHKIVSKINSLLSWGILPYLSNDGEIQARMHTVLAQGYRNTWKRLPATKHELWGALISSGLNAPLAIRRELAANDDPGVRDFYQPGPKAAFNRASQKCTNPHVTELNAVHASLLRDDAKEKYWQEVLPYLYGHLVELYGDPLGRQRMGVEPQKIPTLEEIFNNCAGKVIKSSELDKKIDQLYKTELSRGERILLHTVEEPVSYIGAIVKYVVMNNQTNDHAYEESGDAAPEEVYMDEAFFNKIKNSGELTVTPKLTQKTHVSFDKALAQCTDYRDDVRSGKLKPRV